MNLQMKLSSIILKEFEDLEELWFGSSDTGVTRGYLIGRALDDLYQKRDEVQWKDVNEYSISRYGEAEGAIRTELILTKEQIEQLTIMQEEFKLIFDTKKIYKPFVIKMLLSAELMQGGSDKMKNIGVEVEQDTYKVSDCKEAIREEDAWVKMYKAAKSRLRPRTISEYVTAGEVSAAIMSKTGKIYTGVCIDTCSTLGICAERNAIFNMVTEGENDIDKVLCIMSDGANGAPCGACRELMVQLMPGRYQDIEIMMDYKSGRIETLGNLTPEWWIK